MELTAHSQNRLMDTFAYWEVPKDYADPLYNYLVYGHSPGSFFTALLANDFMGAVAHSHPQNTIAALKHTVGWMKDTLDFRMIGSYGSVNDWLALDDAERRKILEDLRLIYTGEREVILILKDEPTTAPILW